MNGDDLNLNTEQALQSETTATYTQQTKHGKNVSYKFKRWMALIVVGVMTFGFLLFNLLCFTLFKQSADLALNEWNRQSEFDFQAYKRLSADQNGDFTILQLSDLHVLNGVSVLDNKTFTLANNLVERVDPDLIVLTGDVVLTWDNERTFKIVIDFFDEICKTHKINWCVTFGNQDETGYVDKTVISELLMTSKYCLFEIGPTNLNDDGKYGNTLGNYAINITDYAGKDKCSLVFMDSNVSGASSEEGLYPPISADTIGWYEWFINGMTQQTGTILPSMAFFHIPLLQNKLMTQEMVLGQDGYCEQVRSSNKDTGLYSVMKNLNSTIAVFSGHDHQNYYQGYYGEDDIMLASCMACGYCTYGDVDIKGGRVININVNQDNLGLDTFLLFAKDLV